MLESSYFFLALFDLFLIIYSLLVFDSLLSQVVLCHINLYSEFPWRKLISNFILGGGGGGGAYAGSCWGGCLGMEDGCQMRCGLKVPCSSSRVTHSSEQFQLQEARNQVIVIVIMRLDDLQFANFLTCMFNICGKSIMDDRYVICSWKLA